MGAEQKRATLLSIDYMAFRDLIVVALVIAAASASTADEIDPEGVEERAEVQVPLHATSASDIEKVILKLQAGQPDKVVTMPTSLLGVGWKETIGKEFIYGNAPLHVGNRYLCWDVGDGRGDGKIINTRCGPRTAKNRALAALAKRISKSKHRGPHAALHGGRHIKAIARYISSKFGKMTPLEKIQAKSVAKEQMHHTEKKTAKITSKMATMRAMSAKIHCKRTACARKAERLSKAQERNHKFTVSEKKAKKAKEEHAKKMENHEKKNAILKKLAQKKMARVKVALEKSGKLTKREHITKMEVKKAYKSAKKAKNKDADVAEISD